MMPGHRIRPKAKENEKQCAYCPRTFTRDEHLRRHERSHTGEKPFKCHKCNRKYSRSDVLARHLQSHPSNRASEALPKATVDLNQACLRDKKDPLFVHEYQLQTPAMGLADPAQCWSINNYHTTADPTHNLIRESPCASSRQDTGILASFLDFHVANSSGLDVTASNGSNHAVTKQTPVERATGIQLCLGQENANQQQESSKQQAQQLPLQRMNQTPLVTQPGTADTDLFLGDADFNDHNPLSPGILDIFDFDTLLSPELAPHDVAEGTRPGPGPGPGTATEARPGMLFSDHQVQQMRHLWRGQRPTRGIRLGPSLWRSVVLHPADSIFSGPGCHSAGCMEPATDSQGTCGRAIDESCRTAMICFCKRLDEKGDSDSLAELTPRSTSRGDSISIAEDEPPMPMSATDGFPSMELVEASIDAFFEHAPLPFMHKTTFDARAIPMSLLLPILLIDLSSLYPERSKWFVLRYLKNLLGFCRNEMASKALGSFPPSGLLVCTASTLLVVYLSLGYLEDLDEGQAHMLCAQMLHVVEKHGIFTASDQDDLAFQLHAGPSDPEGSWKSWVRVESIKRMISCLLWTDMAYTRLMGTAGVVDIDKVEIHQPCDDAIFNAPNAAAFIQLAKCGRQVIMPSMAFHNAHANPHPTPTPGHFLTETSLVTWYLQIAAIRHRLRLGNCRQLELRTHCPAEPLSKCRKARDVIASIVALPARSPNLFLQRHKATALAWHNINIALTADLDLLEIASGCDGPQSARAALAAVSKWAQAPGARRAALHAAQIYNLLSSSRLRELNIARPDLLLFNSALVLSMYLFVSGSGRDWAGRSHSNRPPFELLDEVDWTTLDQEGLLVSQSAPPSNGARSAPSSDARNLHSHEPASASAACNFIRGGGPASFAGEVQRGSQAAARKILLNYVRLLDDLGKWRKSRYSRLLRTMSDLIVEGNH